MYAPLNSLQLFVIAKIWKQPNCPSVEEDKNAVLYLNNGILLGLKKEGNLTIWASMDRPVEHYANWNPCGFTYIWNLINKMYWEGK